MLKIFLVILFLPLISLADFSSRDSWKFGMGLGVHRTGDFATIDFSSPTFFEFTLINLNQKSGLFFSTGFHNSYNAFIEDSKFQAAQSWINVVGIENRTAAVGNQMSAFSRLGLVHVNRNGSIYSEPKAFAYLIGAGMDFVLVQERQDLVGGSSSASLYVAFQGFFGLGRADLVSNSPDLFNGLTMLVGIRNHF
ncbi:MAG: hypothetical protein AB8E15_07350 [Bdellovibrionales bacterium]